MTKSPMTRASLLVRIRNRRDTEAWAEFVEIYAPLIYALVRRHGLQDADAADLTQEVLKSVLRSAADFRYDPARGTFRGWLVTVTRNHLRRWASSQKPDLTGTGTKEAQRLLEEQLAPEEVE